MSWQILLDGTVFALAFFELWERTNSWCECSQWRNRRGGRGAECPPETSDREIFADVSGKKRQGKKGKWWKLSRKGGKLEMEAGKRQKKRWGPFFFFAFHFWKRRKFVLGLPKWEFSTGKKHFTPRKKSENDFAPSEKYACYAPECSEYFVMENVLTNFTFARFLFNVNPDVYVWRLFPRDYTWLWKTNLTNSHRKGLFGVSPGVCVCVCVFFFVFVFVFVLLLLL